MNDSRPSVVPSLLRGQRILLDALLTIGGCVAAAGVVLLLLAFMGFAPGHVLDLWYRGSMGSRYALADTLTKACPLLLTGLAAAVTFRAGVFNIGAQGQLLVGAALAVALSTRWLPPDTSPWIGIPLCLLAGAIAGALWGLLASLLELFRRVPIVLSTILLNFAALYLVKILLHSFLQAHGTSAPQSSQVPPHFCLPILMKYTSLHAGLFLAAGIVVILEFIQTMTVFGFQTTAIGLNAAAAKLAGMPAAWRQIQVMLIGAGCAGLAGAMQILGVAHFMTAKIGNYGYAGIAVALLGRLDPFGVAMASLFFGALDAGAQRAEESSLGLPHETANVIKAIIILSMLLVGAWSMRRTLRSGLTRPDEGEAIEP